MIGIIDYGMGNLRSVQKAFEALDLEARLLTDPGDVMDMQRLILPGVGAIADGMANLNDRGWTPAISSFIATGRPFLGICLGMQLLLDSSQEDAASENEPVAGLGLIHGKALKFVSPAADGTRIKIPHMGWNQLHWQRNDPLLTGLEQGSNVYFVHGYYCKPDDESIVSATTDYGLPFCATLWHQNIWATQFHPEKSQAVGLTLLSNFATRCDSLSPV